MSVFGIPTSFLAFQSRVQQATSLLSLFQPSGTSSTPQSLFPTAQAQFALSAPTSPQQILNSQISQLANNELTTLVTQNTNEINTLSQNQTPSVANPNANVIQFFNSQNALLTGQLTQNTLNSSNPFSLLSSTTSALLQQLSLNLREITTLNAKLDPSLPNGNPAAVNVLNQQNVTITSAINSNLTALAQLPSFIQASPPPAPPSQSVPFYFFPPRNGNLLSLSI
ncbi:MAG: hypothetical protein HYR63_15160 [Proteobacteria bacterium]|nr:hypothetical protein [Pseudomonadota bacterium]MBI3496600.1 hypothetical protein [Pseudomonadota bacterium]